MTYKQLAEMCDVSRATVDRVIHNRGKVKPEVAQRILEAAKANNFKPNNAGRALALARSPVKIGVLVHLTKYDVFQAILEGLDSVKGDIISSGGEIVLKQQTEFDAKEQLRLLNELVDEGVKGIALSPAQDVQLKKRLAELSAQGIPIVTFNTEIDGIDNLCHVGVDNVQGGRLGAYFMDLLLRGIGGKVLIISGHMTQRSNFQRVNGFVSECSQKFPSIDVIGLELNRDDEERAYELTLEEIERTPDLAGILMVSCGREGVCRALESVGKAGKIKLIAYDLMPATKCHLDKGSLQVVLDQDAYSQGKMASKILCEYLSGGKIESRIENKFSIITSYNF